MQQATLKDAKDANYTAFYTYLLCVVILLIATFFEKDNNEKQIGMMIGLCFLQSMVIFAIKKLIRGKSRIASFQIGKSVLIAGLVLIFVNGLGYFLLDQIASPDEGKSNFDIDKPMTFITGVYFALVTGSTVGYGDINPVSPAARFMVMNQIVSQVLFAVDMLTPIS